MREIISLHIGTFMIISHRSLVQIWCFDSKKRTFAFLPLSRTCSPLISLLNLNTWSKKIKLQLYIVENNPRLTQALQNFKIILLPFERSSWLPTWFLPLGALRTNHLITSTIYCPALLLFKLQEVAEQRTKTDLNFSTTYKHTFKIEKNREHGIAPDGTMLSKEPPTDKSYQTFYRTLLWESVDRWEMDFFAA